MSNALDLGSPQERRAETRLLSLDSAGLRAAFEQAKNAGPVAREFLSGIRAQLKERQFAGASGASIVRQLTAAVDRMMRALYEYADAQYRRRFPRLNQRLAIIARGGYGRGELNPYSDVDLLFLHDWKVGPYVEIVVEIILRALWDARLTVGNVLRNLPECVKMADEDLREKTAIIDARYLAGDRELYVQFDSALTEEILNRNQRKFFRAKLEESRERHARLGDSVYLLEPHLKEGEGGLRDLHTALWLAKVKYKVRRLEELVHKAVITQAELAEIERARDFLWRVRNSLHFLAGRHFDQLTFEYQERIAPLFGFRPDLDGAAASAAMMRAYYQQASVVYRFSEGLIARVIESRASRGFLRRSAGRQIRPGVVIQGNLLNIHEPQFFAREPLNLLTIFADCQAHGVELSGSAYQMVRDHLGLIDEGLRTDVRTGAALKSILAAPKRVAETLEAMHRAGVLGAIIPEFGNLYARVLHDLYHIYTVDRHSLIAVGELERLRAGQFKPSAPTLTEVAREVSTLPLIFLALVLHDIGKGEGHDHHERGALLTEEVSRRLGLDGEELDLVVFLVRNHLLMSQIAPRGDLEDEGTVAEFARQVGSIDRLKALYLMTFADMRAVAPNVYNNWRDMLLGDLYMRTLKMLEQGDREAVDPARRLMVVKSAARERLKVAGASIEEVEKFISLMPDRYFFTVPEGDVAAHFGLIRALAERELVCRHRHFPELEYTEFTVATRDQPGLFSKIAGALTANNLNILSARITTGADGSVLDVFRISHPSGLASMVMEEERWARVERDLGRVIRGEQDIAELVASAQHVQRAARKFTRRVPTEVTVDNRSSEQYTVVDVFTQDRVGLLFAITHTLFSLGLLIHVARISTNADQALDVFYITDRAGHKLADLARLRELREALVARLEANEGEAGSGAA